MRNGMGKLLHLLKTNKNIPIYAAAVLLYMTMISSYCISGVYASYATSEVLGDNARVAKFSVKGDGILSQPVEAELVPGTKETASLNIYNNSEVTVEYTISVSNETGNLPLELRMTKEGDPTPIQVGTGSVTLTAQQLPGEHVDRYGLDIEWKAEDDDPEWMGKVDYIAVTVTAVQVD